jgi:hypothetical protein
VFEELELIICSPALENFEDATFQILYYIYILEITLCGISMKQEVFLAATKLLFIYKE